MKSYSTFYFESYEFDRTRRIARLHYSLDKEVHFVDEVEFRFAVSPHYNEAALDRVLRSLWLMSGVSYLKAALPPKITVEGPQLTEAEADFFSTTYRLGLGQLCYENKVPLSRVAQFPYTSTASAPVVYEGDGDLVGFGGGKDSLVSTSILESAGRNFATFSATYIPTSNTALTDLAKMVGKTHLEIQRRFDPQLLELNRNGAYNGHIPVTAIISLIGLAAAVLTSRQNVILSNEASAGEGNVRYDGVEINHQYAKTLEFERMLTEHITSSISKGLGCFSLLRPLGELQIAELFLELDSGTDMLDISRLAIGTLSMVGRRSRGAENVQNVPSYS